MEKPECCKTCGRYTERGKRQLAEESKARPIYGTDFSKPLGETIEKLRSDIGKVRGQISDISFAYPGWGEHLACVEGLLTCGLVTLFGVKARIEEHDKRYPKAATPPAEGDDG